MKKAILTTAEYDNYYQNYINLVPENQSLIDGYYRGKKTVVDFFRTIPKDKLSYRYQPNKWTIKEVLQHLIDTERIFMYRCLRIARNDNTNLASYEQNDYIVPSGANEKSIDNLLLEYETNKNNSIIFLQSLSNDNLAFVGSSSGNKLSARACAFIIIGHEKWHMQVIQERYL